LVYWVSSPYRQRKLKKRAKTSYLVKALVCLQASWLVAQVIGRAFANIPITTLEIVTVGYVICALITYICCWHKPQDAEVHITIDCRMLTKAKFHEQAKEVYGEPEQDTRALPYMTSGIFGAVHGTAWNFFFLTFAESVTWRVTSVLTAVIPVLWWLLIMKVEDNKPDWMMALCVLLFLLYVPVRRYLMIEPFVAFRSVQIGIFYTIDWPNWIPHVQIGSYSKLLAEVPAPKMKFSIHSGFNTLRIGP
jgi:hypothetical protein